MRKGILALALLAGAALPVSGAAAATDVVIFTIDLKDQKICQEQVENLREEAKNEAGTPMVAAHADAAADYCRTENYAMAEQALSDGYRWLQRKSHMGAER